MPAIITKGFAFNSNVKKVAFVDDLKYRICAPAMIPMEIYRNDDSEYYVEFTVEEIEAIHSKFMSNLTNKDIFNLEHNSETIVPAYLLEAWIVEDPKTDKAYMSYGIEVPKGTLMVTTQITDKNYYNELVDNGQTGYSIEGFLGMKLSEMQRIQMESFNDYPQSIKDNDKIGIKLDDKTSLSNNENNNNKQQKLKTMNETQSMLPAGEYTDAEGKVFVVDAKGNCTLKAEMAQDASAELAPNATETASGTTETKLEEMAAAPVKEAPIEEEMAIDPIAPETVDVLSYTKEEVDAKFEELYKLIGDMQAEDDLEDVVEGVQPVAMSIHDKFAAFVAFSQVQSNQ